MDENQNNLVKMTQHFDASPAVTMGMPQDPYFGSKRVETARSAALVASPLNLAGHGPAQHDAAQHGTDQHGFSGKSETRLGAAQRGTAWDITATSVL